MVSTPCSSASFGTSTMWPCRRRRRVVRTIPITIQRQERNIRQRRQHRAVILFVSLLLLWTETKDAPMYALMIQSYSLLPNQQMLHPRRYCSNRRSSSSRHYHSLSTKKVSSSCTSLLAAPSKSSSSSSSSDLSILPSEQLSELYTVKELKQYIKDNMIGNQRGILTKLQKKQDMIEYIKENQNNSVTKKDHDDADVVTTTIAVPPPQLTSPTLNKNKRTISTMAPLSPSFVGNTTAANRIPPTSTVRTTNTNPTNHPQPLRSFPSPKDQYIEEVYKRYPPIRLRDEIQKQKGTKEPLVDHDDDDDDDDDDDVAAEDDDDDTTNEQKVASIMHDIRQQYHPIFRNGLSTEQQREYDQYINRTAAAAIASQHEVQHVENESSSNDGTTDIHDMIIKNSWNILSKSDMDLVFIGTASCSPGMTRGTSCTALRLNWQQRQQPIISSSSSSSSSKQQRRYPDGRSSSTTSSLSSSNGIIGTWLFDVGECTQLQIQRTTSIKPSKITKIFLTHAHGDHSFGLPGLLCLMGTGNSNTNEKSPVIEIYGPEGLRMWLRVAIRYSVSRIVPPYVVHEIKNVPMAPEWEFNHRFKRYYYNGFQQQQQQQNSNYNRNGNPNRQRSKGLWGTKGLAGEDPTSWITRAKTIQLEPSALYGEMEGGRDIYPEYDHPKGNDGAPIWKVIEDEMVNVYAAPMSHGIPCIGYCIEEANRPGRLKNEIVEPIVRRNLDSLKEAGFRTPMKVMAILKNLKPNTEFTFPDGTVVTHDMAVEAPRRGRKIVICGDTADSRAMTKLASNADVIVHEATNAYLPGVETKKDTSYVELTRDCIIHGHSTPQMAGTFCKNTNGRLLVLNHFSSRYKGDITSDSLSIMMRIEKQAMEASGLNETQVAAAWDFMILPIPQH